MSAATQVVITCDGCGAQYVHAGVAREMARAAAVNAGWSSTWYKAGAAPPRDYCPKCSDRKVRATVGAA